MRGFFLRLLGYNKMMKNNYLLVLAILLIYGSQSVSAVDLRPLNVQNARMDLENKNELRVNFDWIHEGIDAGGLGNLNINSFTLPRINYKRTFNTKIPTRIGASAGLGYNRLSVNDIFGIDGLDGSGDRFGFQNIGLSLEAGVIQKENIAVALYINQHFPTVNSDLLGLPVLSNSLPVYGTNAYGFQSGSEIELHLGKNLAMYSDLAYRFDKHELIDFMHSFVYFNEAVLSLGDKKNYGLSLGVLGNTFYGDVSYTDLRLTPGLILGLGDENQHQLRIGMPIGLNETSPDIGVQASYFSSF